jgi:hypothetical protein
VIPAQKRSNAAVFSGSGVCTAEHRAALGDATPDGWATLPRRIDLARARRPPRPAHHAARRQGRHRSRRPRDSVPLPSLLERLPPDVLHLGAGAEGLTRCARCAMSDALLLIIPVCGAGDNRVRLEAPAAIHMTRGGDEVAPRRRLGVRKGRGAARGSGRRRMRGLVVLAVALAAVTTTAAAVAVPTRTSRSRSRSASSRSPTWPPCTSASSRASSRRRT